MKIAPSTIIMLSDNTPNVRPQINGYALAEAYKNGTFRTKIFETEYYVAFTENTKILFDKDIYLGGMITIRKKGEKINSSNLESHTFYLHGEAIVINGKHSGVFISPVGSYHPTIIMESGEIGDIKKQFKNSYHELYDNDPMEFEMNWGKFIANKPDFHYYSGRLTF